MATAIAEKWGKGKEIIRQARSLYHSMPAGGNRFVEITGKGGVDLAKRSKNQ